MKVPSIAVPNPSVRRAAVSYSIRPGWAALALVAVISVLAGDIPLSYQYAPLLVSVLLLGLPHGAVDHLVIARQRDESLTPRWLGIVGVVYLLFGVAYGIVWFVFPVAAFGFFILLTWFHWGQGELYVLQGLYVVDHVDDFTQQVLTVVVRGGLPMVVPLLGFPGRYREVVGSFVAPFGGEVGSWWLFDAWPRLLLMAAFGLVTILALARGWTRATDRQGWRLDAVECGLLWVVFMTVPPVLAVGVYFCLWHSVRHIARVLLLDGQSVDAIAEHRFGRALWRFTLEAAVPTVLALAFAGALLGQTGISLSNLADATGLYLVAIAVLTLPHTVVVILIDRAQGIWQWPPTAATNG